MKVSVCMATYNGERYVEEQIASILGQLGAEDELIISDDGSADGTLGIIEAFNDPRIAILNFNGKDIIRNFENALNHSSGDYIFLADQDDIWMENKLKVCMHYLERFDLVFSNLLIFGGDITGAKLLYPPGKPRTGLIRNLIKNNYIGATMAFRREVLKRATPFPDKIEMHDMWLALVAETTGSTYFIEEPLMYYRRHGENASETGSKSPYSLAKKFKIRFYLAYYLIKSFL